MVDILIRLAHADHIPIMQKIARETIDKYDRPFHDP